MLQPTIASGSLRVGANGVTQVWTETGRQQSEKIVRGVELPSIWGGVCFDTTRIQGFLEAEFF